MSDEINPYGLYVERYCKQCDIDLCKAKTLHYKELFEPASADIMKCIELKEFYKRNG